MHPSVLEQDSKIWQLYQTNFVQPKGKLISYGTAGFRDHEKCLDLPAWRVGLFMGLVAKLDGHKVLGVMITASHNPIQDNGIKQTDFDGGMLRTLYEKQVEIFVNDPDLNHAVEELKGILQKDANYKETNQGMVFIGQDTRPSSERLVNLCIQGVQAVGSLFKSFGEVTTPMLCHNVLFFNFGKHDLSRHSWNEQITCTYFDNYTNAFQKFFTELKGFQKKEDELVILDCSNGVGGKRIEPFLSILDKYINLEVVNQYDLEHLNQHCGAEFVHKEHQYPLSVTSKIKNPAKTRCLSFDGDADRIVYFQPDEKLEKLHLIDGDKMITLYAIFFSKALEKLSKATSELNKTGLIHVNEDFSKWNIGLVQTAYANGSSTSFIRNNLKLQVVFSPNGVKNLHPHAHKFDIGIYCESNGHGTFLVHHEKTELLGKLIEQFSTLSINFENEDQKTKLNDFLHEANQLHDFILICNQSVGDAITNFLCIEACLAYLNYSCKQYLDLYEDFKCQNSKVAVKDRTKLKVVYTEDRVTEPEAVQSEIDEIVKKYQGSRAFVRPSGTEDYVRIYAEHENIEIVKKITDEIKQVLISNKEIN